MNNRVLLIGRNPTVLINLASALTDEGFAVKTTNRVEQAGQDFDAADFDVVAFGRGVDAPTNERLRATFTAHNPTVRFIDGLAPVIPILVKQIKLTLANRTIPEKVITDFGFQQTESLHIRVATVIDCQLTIDLYQLDAVHTIRQQTLVSQFVTAGNHRFFVDIKPDANSTINFLLAEAATLDLAVSAAPLNT